MRLLVLEDDAALRRRVVAAFRARGDAVDEVGTLEEADEKMFVGSYDVAIFDRTVADGDAAGLVQRLRTGGSTTPILFVTALDAVEHRVAGLDAGGDDYLVKPFAIAEMEARVRSLARRSPTVDQPVLVLEDLTVDPAALTVRRSGRPILLTSKEFAILVLLLCNSGRVVSRTTLLERCWDEYADPSSNVIDVRIRLLRRKFGDPPLVQPSAVPGTWHGRSDRGGRSSPGSRYLAASFDDQHSSGDRGCGPEPECPRVEDRCGRTTAGGR